MSLLKELYPENPGYQHLADKTLVKAKKQMDFDLKASWNVFVKAGKGRQFPGKKQNTINPDSYFRIHYHAKKDSYQYLFLTDITKKETKLVFPENPSSVKTVKADNDFQAHVTAGRRGQIIPAKGWANFYNTENDQLLWGWSCMAPIRPNLIKVKLQNLSNWLMSNLTPFPFSNQLPDLCLNHFYQVYSQI